MTGSVLLVERVGDVTVLTLNRPKAANALNSALHEALVAALQRAGDDGTTRAIVLKASGERAFSAGADLREFADQDPEVAKKTRRKTLLRTLLAVLDSEKPVVAAMTGRAIGAGAMLALMADTVIAAESARFSFPEISLGMPSPVGVSIIHARAGRAAAQQLVMAGHDLDAHALAKLGLVDVVAQRGQVDEAAIAQAKALAVLAGDAYAGTKRWMNRTLRAELAQAADESDALQDAAHAKERR